MTETVDQRSLWQQAKAGDVLPPHDRVPCFAAGRYGLECGRAEQHSGQHVATGGGVVLHVWDDPDVTSLDSFWRRLDQARGRR